LRVEKILVTLQSAKLSLAMDRLAIYTVGHSNHPVEAFLELLYSQAINCIVDVRSVPASAYNPQYNQAPLKSVLKRNKISYLHFADEFGARQTAVELLNSEGKLDFEKVRRTERFRQGVERIRQGVEKGFRIALMCSESEPIDCHRFSMVSIGLEQFGFEVLHILKDKSLKTNRELEEELLKKYEKKIPQPSLFEPKVSFETQLRAALQLKNKEIGYSPSETYKEQEDRYD